MTEILPSAAGVPPAWFELAIRSSRETVIFTDTDRAIIYANPAVFDSHGYLPEELLGHSSREIFGDIPGNPPDLARRITREAVGGVWKGQVYNRRKDGSVFPVRLVLSAIYGKTGEVLGYAGISTDISEEERRREETAEFMKQLEDGNRFKTEFISTLSHEIRTPLTSIRAFASILLKMGDKADEETRKDFIGQIHAAAERLTALLNRMLDMTRMETGKITFKDETVNLTGLAWEAITDMQGLALETEVSLRLLDPPLELLVLGDPIRLREVFSNLLSNAIKYSPRGGEVTVGLSREKAPEPRVRIEIRDQGPGIPEGDEKKIFESFRQAVADGKNGFGIGLAICRRIVEHYGGRISSSNLPGGGTCFTVTLPLSR